MIEMCKNALLIATAFLIFSACGQTKKATAQNEPSKKSQALFTKGLQQQSLGEYNDAVSSFKAAIKKSPGFLDAYDALAHTFQKAGASDRAVSVYRQLLELKSDHLYALYSLGNIYISNEQIDSAEYYFRTFLKYNKTKDKNTSIAVRNLQNISFMREAIANPMDINPINIGSSINTNEQEYSPAFAIDEQTMYITRRTGDLRDSRPNEDIYFATRNTDGSWNPIKNLGRPINTSDNEGAFSISSDGHYIFFTSCSRRGGKGQCDIWLTIDNDGEWSEPMNLQAPINTRHWESQPSIASNGKTLYFTSDRPGGYGGTDLWKANFGETGWEEPINLGPEINTPFDEQFPFIHSDNNTLYFSSEGHPGMGKSDLFLSRLGPEGNWGSPVNLGHPINTSGYDWNMIVARDGKTALYSSDKMPDGKGGLDIYTFQLPTKLQAQRVSYARGFIRDADTKRPLAASVILTPQSGGVSTNTYADQTDGMFLVPLKADQKYALTIDKDGYLLHSEYFDMPNVDTDKPFEIIIDLKKVKIGKSVVLKNVFFDTDKYELKENSINELQKLIDFMKINPDISIEIGGHTDNVGNKTNNIELSTNRAKSVYNYLVKNGVSSTRLTFQGYGDNNPIESNSTEQGRAINRRTEFKVTK